MVQFDLPTSQQGKAELRNVMESYFHLGMNFKEILLLVWLTHGFYIKYVAFEEHSKFSQSWEARKP